MNKINLSALPGCLHGRSLNKVINDEWRIWAKEYKWNFKFKCQLCGISKVWDKANCHGHERYIINHDTKEIIFRDVLCLCSNCHNTYHAMFVSFLPEDEKMDQLNHLKKLDSRF